MSAEDEFSFQPRGIGQDHVPCCFVCACELPHFAANIAAFIKSRDDGESIVRMFDGRARVDYRPSEPRWIQLKVGTCQKHLPNLQMLYSLTAEKQRIRASIVHQAMEEVAP